MRPLLRPGTHVLRRTDGLLQVGLEPTTAVVLPDSPSVRDRLDGLDGSTATAEGDQIVDLLESQSLLVDEGLLMPLVGPVSDQAPLGRGVGAALVREAGSRSVVAAEARRAHRVQAVGFGHPDGGYLVDELRALLGRSGMRPAARRSERAARSRGLVGALVGLGEPDRELVDGWTRAGTPFIVVRLTEGRAVVGPLVVPGVTACLRCVDAHHTDADPSWPLLVRQYAAASSSDRRDGVPEPLDPALGALAVAWAARDLATFAGGGRPSTWSATLTFDAGLSSMETRPWLRHPECGCGWL